jgi:hypothetical protein
MTDKDRGTKPQPNEDLPADEDLEESPEEFVEAEEEFEEEPLTASAEAAPAATARGRRAEQAGARQLGSVREGHERVRVDDRLSALFALFAAALLIGVLILPWAGGFLPAPAEPTLTPLVIPTYDTTTTPAPSASVAPTATPTVSASPAS